MKAPFYIAIFITAIPRHVVSIITMSNRSYTVIASVRAAVGVGCMIGEIPQVADAADIIIISDEI